MIFRPTELRFQFTVRGFSKCDAAFVHYLNHIHYLVRKCHINACPMTKKQAKQRETMILKPRGDTYTAIVVSGISE